MSEVIPVIYFAIQLIPFMLLEYSGFSYLKLMRKADSGNLRSADLVPRKITHFISPIYLTIAVLLIFVCLAFFTTVNGFELSFANDTFIILLALILSNGLYAIIIYKRMYGKKLDPHQSSEDRMRYIGVTIRSLVFLSIGASIFLVVIEAVDQYESFFLPAIVMSLYLQFVIVAGLGIVLRVMDLDKLNFEVYRDTPKTA